MKRFKVLGCKDIGIFCDFEARAPEAEKLVEPMGAHTAETHGLDFQETEMSYRIGEWARPEGKPGEKQG